MLRAAGRGFREHGFSGIGVDGLAGEAGVTSGAFYTHFGSKSAAFDEALLDGLNEVISAVPGFQEEHGQEWVRAFAEYYLGREHRKDVGGGCAMAALTSEVVKMEPDVQGAYENRMKKIAALMAGGLAGGSEFDRLARAWSILGTLIGGVNIARAVKTARTADEIAESIIESAISTAGETR